MDDQQIDPWTGVAVLAGIVILLVGVGVAIGLAIARINGCH